MYYHVSYNILNEIKEFYPRVPKSRVEGENKKIKRICVAKTLEGAISAIPNSSKLFANYENDCLFKRPQSFEPMLPLLRVYEISEEDVKKGNLIENSSLYKTDKVRDADFTGECWIIKQNIKPVKSYVINMLSTSVNLKDNVSYKELMMAIKNDEDSAYYSTGCFRIIESMNYEVVPEEKVSSTMRVNGVITVTPYDDYTMEDIKDSLWDKLKDALGECVIYIPQFFIEVVNNELILTAQLEFDSEYIEEGEIVYHFDGESLKEYIAEYIEEALDDYCEEINISELNIC